MMRSSSDTWIFLGILLGGFVVTAGCVVGVVFVARRYKNEDDGGKALLIVAMIGLSLLALVGVFATGCSAIMLLG